MENKQLQKENDELRAHVERLRKMLTERDGGDHDADCKHYNGRGCTCLHMPTVEILNETPYISINHTKREVEAETILRCKEFMELNGDDADLAQIPRLHNK